MILQGLQLAAKNVHKSVFQREYGDMLLEGLQSQEYVTLDERDYIHMTLKGTRALLDLEGYEWRTGLKKRR